MALGRKRYNMPLELDHVFVCCASGAPEGDALIRLGLTEGTPNTHPGQGTANRRFFFRNAFLELLWVSDPAEARSDQTRRTRLYERWSGRASGACPFGIVFRPKGANATKAPFTTWAYHPKYIPPELAIEFAEGVPLEEPELVFIPFLHRSGPPASEPTVHILPVAQMCGVTIGLPSAARLSQPAQAVHAANLATYVLAHEHVLEVTFLAREEMRLDLRPTLPLVFHGVA